VKVLVHGATGFTGKLVCAELARRGVGFAVSGRNREKLEALAEEHGAAEVVVVDVGDAASLDRAVKDRAIVCACAGPFGQVGEPMVAACARAGVHYVDTTGEQRFVADMAERWSAEAEKTGACLVPAMAFEIVPSDWAAHIAAERAGGAPDSIEILYANKVEGGYGAATSRGTKLSALGMLGEKDTLQWVDGRLTREPAAEIVRAFELSTGKRLLGASFPSPEAIVVPPHTGARTVRTFMATGTGAARLLHSTRKAAPLIFRAVARIGKRWVDSSREGPPEDERRRSVFEIVAVAKKNGETSTARLRGRDMYGLTAELQAFAAERALAGKIAAKGLVAPSVAFPPRECLASFPNVELL
jgi:short subunit dehydrogenase-like uncharacterized protein